MWPLPEETAPNARVMRKTTPKMLLSVGELSARKNHQLMIEAMALLRDLDLRYVICGTGDKQKMLQQRILELGLEYRSFWQDIRRIFQNGLPVQTVLYCLPIRRGFR